MVPVIDVNNSWSCQECGCFNSTCKTYCSYDQCYNRREVSQDELQLMLRHKTVVQSDSQYVSVHSEMFYCPLCTAVMSGLVCRECYFLDMSGTLMRNFMVCPMDQQVYPVCTPACECGHVFNIFCMRDAVNRDGTNELTSSVLLAAHSMLNMQHDDVRSYVHERVFAFAQKPPLGFVDGNSQTSSLVQSMWLDTCRDGACASGTHDRAIVQSNGLTSNRTKIMVLEQLFGGVFPFMQNAYRRLFRAMHGGGSFYRISLSRWLCSVCDTVNPWTEDACGQCLYNRSRATMSDHTNSNVLMTYNQQMGLWGYTEHLQLLDRDSKQARVEDDMQEAVAEAVDPEMHESWSVQYQPPSTPYIQQDPMDST